MSATFTIVSDMGNVVLYFDHRKTCRGLAHYSAMDAEAIYEAIFGADRHRPYEQGTLSSDAFRSEVECLIGASVRPDAFARIWGDVFWANEPTIELYQQLRGTGRFALLSNTNDLHWNYIEPALPKGLFEHTILSFRVGACKPEPAIYEEACRAIADWPKPWLYVDDIARYAEASEAYGMTGVHFTDAEALGEHLRAMGLV